MPLLNAKSATGPVAITKDGDRIVAYTLTSAGVKKLREAGVRSGREFPFRALAALIRSGQAHSPHPADAAGQKQFGFDCCDEAGQDLPRCEMTGVTSDVHLVVYGDGSGTVARLLGPEPRFVLQKVTTLSIPVTVLSLAVISQLETAHKLPLKSPAATTLREWLRQDMESIWEQFQKQNARKQGVLSLGHESGELEIDES